jgi:hypothetical protein
MEISLTSQENTFLKAKTKSITAARASFRVAHIVDKGGKPTTGGGGGAGEKKKFCMNKSL